MRARAPGPTGTGGIGLQRADDSVNVLNRSRLAGVVASVSAATAETAAGDENGELARILGAHLQDEHDLEVDEEELTELVESESYEAVDS